MVAQQRAGAPPHPGILLSGSIPPLTDWYFQRPETGVDLRSGLFPGQTVVLTHGEQTTTAPAAQGGTGKTQLAVEFTQALRSAGAVEVLIWITATSREAILVSFAQAAGAVGAGDPDADAEAAATRFVAWLSHTERPWALILDDLSDPADLEDLWPAGPAGQVVITTRLPGTALSPPALRPARIRRPAVCGSCRSAGSAAGRRLTTSAGGSRTIPTSGSRRSTSARTWTGCRSAWRRRSR